MMNVYSIMSGMYDLLEVTYFANKNRNPRVAINALIQKEDAKVLDLCCGTLANSLPIAKYHKHARIYGIDLSEKMLQVGRQKLRRNGIRNVSVRQGDAANTKLKEGAFDYIVIGLALHEMKSELQKSILAEAHRLLKEEGSLIVLEWEESQDFLQRVFFFPLLVLEQILNHSFMSFFSCEKKLFFRHHGFELNQTIHCNYTGVYELKKFTL